MPGFLSKKQYAAMAERELAMKLLKERNLDGSEHKVENFSFVLDNQII